MFKIKSILGLVVLGFVVSVGFYSIMISDVNAQECDSWIDYYVDEYGDGTCTLGVAGGFPEDGLNGTGIAKCAFARNGNINCTCKGEHTTPLEEALVFNRSDTCCIFIDGEDPIESDLTSGLATPSGIVNATCHYRP
jgi:hypothetical protein